LFGKTNIINNPKAVQAWKYRLLLLLKLRKSEWNAWNKFCTGFSQYITACVAPGFDFTYMSIWHFFSLVRLQRIWRQRHA